MRYSIEMPVTPWSSENRYLLLARERNSKQPWATLNFFYEPFLGLFRGRREGASVDLYSKPGVRGIQKYLENHDFETLLIDVTDHHRLDKVMSEYHFQQTKKFVRVIKKRSGQTSKG